MARKRRNPPQTPHRPIVPDFELWTRLQKTVTPLDPHHQVEEPESKAAPLNPVRPPTTPTQNKPKVVIAAPKRATVSSVPALTGLDRRTSQRLARGQIEIDARIDLHGESVETARLKLTNFIVNARSRGARTVLVITGKGASEFTSHTLHGSTHFHAPERQGRLRRMATKWFHDADFSHMISGFQPAHPKHGGGGAFYVRLRRADKGRRLP